MSVDVIHPEYDLRMNEWKRIHAVLEGRDAVLEAGEEFVPMLGGQNASQYQAYLLRGLWFGATQRTRKGIVGLVFSQDPQVAIPPAIETFLDDITLTDTSFNEFAKEVFSETVAYNWGGILVDVPPSEDAVLPTDSRPYVTFYHAFNVRWWKRQRIAGKLQTTCVILKEQKEEPIPDQEYGSQIIDIFRVLRLDPLVDENNRRFFQYSQEEWHQMNDPKDPLGKSKIWAKLRVIIPTRKGQSLDFIPFTFTTTEGTEPIIHKSELLDLADVNLDHWRLTCDLRHGLHFTALPTPCAAGIEDGTDLRIGSETAWTSTDIHFNSWYMEYSGTGIGSIQDALERDEHLISLLGSRLLETMKRAAETAEAMVIRQSGDDSVIMSAAHSVEKALEKALWQMNWWVTGQDATNISVSLTRALHDLMITTPDMIVILKAYQSGLLSEQSFLEAFIRKGYIRGRDWQEEAALPRVDPNLLQAGHSPAMDRNTVTTGMGVSNDKSLQVSNK